MKQSINVAYNTFDKYFISTAMWATGMYHPTYETFVWEYDNVEKKRGKLIKQYYHNNRATALQFHFRFCRTLAARQLKLKMISDLPFIMHHTS